MSISDLSDEDTILAGNEALIIESAADGMKFPLIACLGSAVLVGKKYGATDEEIINDLVYLLNGRQACVEARKKQIKEIVDDPKK